MGKALGLLFGLGLAGLASVPFPKSASTRASNAFVLKGLVMKSFARAIWLDIAVTITIGIAFVAGSRRKISQVMNPSNSGNSTSNRIKSGLSERAFLSAAIPSPAVLTEKPA